MITIVCSNNNTNKKIEVEELSGILNHSDSIVWIDLEDPNETEEQHILVQILQLQDHLVKELRHGKNNKASLPKLEEYPDYLFLNFCTIDLLEKNSETPDPVKFTYRTGNLCAFVSKRLIVTHHYHTIKSLSNLREQCLIKPEMLSLGSKYMLHLITDKIIYQYLPCVAYMDTLIEFFEKEIYHNREKKYMEIILHFKSGIVHLRRISFYEREMMYRLSHSEVSHVNNEEKLYFKNEHEHLVRFTNIIDSYLDAVSGLLDAHLSLSSQNMNEVMKMLTIMSTIFLPLSVITGFYGMNLNFLPWSSEHNSYIPVTLFMALVAGTMLMVFKRKKWL